MICVAEYLLFFYDVILIIWIKKGMILLSKVLKDTLDDYINEPLNYYSKLEKYDKENNPTNNYQLAMAIDFDIADVLKDVPFLIRKINESDLSEEEKLIYYDKVGELVKVSSEALRKHTSYLREKED